MLTLYQIHNLINKPRFSNETSVTETSKDLREREPARGRAAGSRVRELSVRSKLRMPVSPPPSCPRVPHFLPILFPGSPNSHALLSRQEGAPIMTGAVPVPHEPPFLQTQFPLRVPSNLSPALQGFQKPHTEGSSHNSLGRRASFSLPASISVSISALPVSRHALLLSAPRCLFWGGSSDSAAWQDGREEGKRAGAVERRHGEGGRARTCPSAQDG